MKTLLVADGDSEPQDDIKDLIAPYQDDLFQCMYAGVKAWHALRDRASDLYRPLKKRTRACFIYDHIIHEVDRLFGNRTSEGITIDKSYGFPMVNFMGLMTTRFKKADKNLRTNNIRTRQQQRLFGIEQGVFSFLQEVPIRPQPFRANVVYQLDDIDEEMIGTYLTQQVGRDVIWSFPLLGTAIEVSPFAPPIFDQLPPTRYTPKQPTQEDTQDDTQETTG